MSRKLPSDEWQWRPSRGRWRYYRWLSAMMGTVGIFNALFAGFWFLVELADTSRLNNDSLSFLGAFSVGFGVVGVIAWRVFSGLGRREPN